MRAPLAVAALAVALVAAPGCGYFLRSPSRPTPSLHYHWGESHARASCLLVLLPGFFDEPDAFEQNGLVEQIHEAAPTCDLVATSIHLYDYRDESVVDRVYEDVVLEARRRGFRQVWLVGISMGALAAVLTAREHPDEIDGIVLVSPYLGTPGFAQRFERELSMYGGLAEWARATPDRPVRIRAVLHDPRPVWRWLAGYRTHPDDMPPLWLAFGRDDRFGGAQRLLAGEVAPERRLVVEGRHDWETWRRITQDLIAELPVDLDAEPAAAVVPPRGQLARRPAESDW